MSSYNLVLASDEMTVMDEYTPEVQNRVHYQTEAELEVDMIKRLQAQGYEYPAIHNVDEALSNLRACLEELNSFKFTDPEWKRFLDTNILKKGDGIKEKTRTIQIDHIKAFVCDDGRTVNVRLIDKNNVYNNKVQVINQYEVTGNHDNRYDVTILINGLPLVHCELKKRGIAIKQAFNQIDRYQRDSFWADNGLFEYVQIFVISNGTHTKYYSNTTRWNAVEENNGKRKAVRSGSNSFEFTSFWADASNKTIQDIVDFIKTFFDKGTLLKILAKYCVFTADETLMVMRPYQIAAVERILTKIKIAENYKTFGTTGAGGYIWHATGSGKTLTSFKTAQLATDMDCIDKVLFVVDRNDLDYQTMREYDRFEKGAANGNKSTRVLTRQLEDKDKDGVHHEYKIIITTIQKLGYFIKSNPQHTIYGKNVVLIFDECHRSQFGEYHSLITSHFKKYAIFGFTGTPIFAENASSSGNPKLRTTEQAFGNRLHTYTVVDAIGDKNVLPFRVDYYNTVRATTADGTLIEDIDDEKIILAEPRVQEIVQYILTHYDQKTMRNAKSYSFNSLQNIADVASKQAVEKKKTVKRQGFNSIFAVSSINAAKVYYTEFKKQMEANPALSRNIALIYSYGVNNDDDGLGYVDENSEDTSALDVQDKDFLDMAIEDYNKKFNTQYSTDNNLFANYYKDLSLRMKNGEVDILIVVNMFLTGFDAVALNTLWVDKHLMHHGLIQAFSRTNRILNSVKAYGNIVCFRNLRKEVDDAIALFGDKEAGGIILLKSYNDYYYGYDELISGRTKHHYGYKENIDKLTTQFSLPCDLVLTKDKKDFIKLFGSILRLQNILRSFDEFEGQQILNDGEMQDYLSIYVDLHEEFKVEQVKEDVSADIVFEMELVRQIVVNIDYILQLVEQYKESHKKDKEIPVDVIYRAIDSNPELRPKKELIERFIATIDDVTDVYSSWTEFKEKQKEQEFDLLVGNENLKEAETKMLIEKIFRLNTFDLSDAEISAILPPMPRFGGGMAARLEKKQRVMELLNEFFIKYCD